MSFVDELRATRSVRDGEEYIRRIKTAVRHKLVSIDNSAEIIDTGYFNHSAVPDFEVTWGEESFTREIFLRQTYRSVEDAKDVEHLAKRNSVLLTLATEEDQTSEVENLQNETLLTTARALQVIGDDNTQISSPMPSLIRSNFLIGAKGAIGSNVAKELMALTPQDAVGSDELISDTFVEESARRIRQTSQLVSAAEGTSDQIEQLIADSDFLSPKDIRNLLPWMLQQPSLINNEPLWKRVGKIIDLKYLEEIRADLAGMDITSLVNANAGIWQAKRAYVGLAEPSEDSEDIDSRVGWSFRNGKLGIDIYPNRIQIAHNGTHLRTRESGYQPRWRELKEIFNDYQLVNVSLTGVQRSISIDAQRASDIQADVDSIVESESVGEDYFVDKVSIRFDPIDSDEEPVDIQAQFRTGLVKNDSGASIANLVDTAVGVLMFRTKNPKTVVESLLSKRSSLSEESDT